jgi:hypothetical protein
MTKKDFILIADALREASQQANIRAGQTGVDMSAGVGFAVHFLADALSLSHERFKKERWLEYVAGICGPNGGKRRKHVTKQR